MAKKEVTLTGPQVKALFERDRAKFEALRRKHASLQQMLFETVTALDALKNVKASDKDEKLKVLLGAGVYAEATLTDRENVEIVLAGNTLLKKTVDRALVDLEASKKDLEEEIRELANEENRLARELSGLSNVIGQAQQKAMAEMKKRRLEAKERESAEEKGKEKK
jgi:prefoldin alpha subunit